MGSRLLSLLLCPLFSACLGAQQPAVPVTTAQASHVLTFRRTVIMDTVTVILEGKVVSCYKQQPLPAAVQLMTGTTTYRVTAAPDGSFHFFHIPAGDYLLTTTYLAYYPVINAPVHLGTGDAAVILIGMACDSSAN